MAGPVSTNEIEDVVSSVRRLVSIEVHDLPGSDDRGQDRLVLTSAQRVGSARATSADPLILTTRVKDEEWQGAGRDTVLHDRHFDAVQLVEAEWEEEIWAEPEPPLAELALGAEEAELVPEPVAEAVAELVKAPVADPVPELMAEPVAEPVPESEPVAEAVGDAVVETVPEPAGELVAEAVVETAPEPAVETMPEPVAEAVPELVSPEPDPAPRVADEGTGSSPWAEVGDDWLEEDLELLAPGQTPPVAKQPADTAEAAAKRPDVLKLSAEDMLTDGEGNPLTVLDEAALQQIIRQLIRDELKGVLGERITHSVRKLVRAEINRALAAHSLD
jgi:hypothetical protein